MEYNDIETSLITIITYKRIRHDCVVSWQHMAAALVTLRSVIAVMVVTDEHQRSTSAISGAGNATRLWPNICAVKPNTRTPAMCVRLPTILSINFSNCNPYRTSNPSVCNYC
ncbi:unnamed protein product [Arctia plantaginis]|uniref:Uncharacterized protein n=1 Tax=Arctia plantaginis TaxID=874455 RepID=A0A8S0Z5R5_ARCPL|nr:unnamed protein product [Arctia plantaginis]